MRAVAVVSGVVAGLVVGVVLTFAPREALAQVVHSPSLPFVCAADRLVGAPVNVRCKGARGNGSTDDTAAVVRAMAAGAGGGVVFPEGTYRLTSSVAVPSGTSVRGVGQGSAWDSASYGQATLTIEGANATALTVAGRGVAVSDLMILHTGAVPATSGALIQVAGHYHTVERVSLGKSASSAGAWDGISVVGTALDAVSGVTLSNLLIRAMKADGVRFQHVADAALTRMVFENVEIGAGVSHGIGLYANAEGVMISHVEVVHASVGLWMDGTAQVRGSAPGYNMVALSYFDSCNWGIYVNYGFQTTFSAVWAASNSFGLWLERGQGMQVNGGVWFANQVGITVRPGVTSTSVVGAQIRDNVTAGVQVQAGVTDFVVQGNDFTSNLGPGAVRAQAAAVTVAAGASDRYVIADNLIRNSGAVTDAGAGANKRVANNY